MGDIQEYRIQTYVKINTSISIPGEADLFITLMCLYLYSSTCGRCSGV